MNAETAMYPGARRQLAAVERRCAAPLNSRPRAAFTIVELLVVVSIVSVLAGALLPALSKARRQGLCMRCGNNQRQIVGAVTLFAADNDGWYPESVATLGELPAFWNWQEPMMLTGYRARHPRMYRSVSAYLRRYVHDADVFYCPGAPRKYKYLQDAWDAGDDWDNPETPMSKDPVSGTYCLYWNYIGYLENIDHLFEGPQGTAGGTGQSRLLVSDYFGYDHWKNPKAYSSSEKFKKVCLAQGTVLSSAYWSTRPGSSARPEVRLHAGYVDGHVESWYSPDTLTMRVIRNPSTGDPYLPGMGPGDVYLPRNAGR
jgi:prepilin-type N-terminal cleavage/methylation domain-containing protein